MVLQQRHPNGAGGILEQVLFVLLSALRQNLDGLLRIILAAEQRGQMQQGHRRDAGVFERIVEETPQFVDCSVDVPGASEHLGALEASLRLQRIFREALQDLLVSGAGGGERLRLIGRLRQQAGQTLLAVTELEQGVGGLRAVRLAAGEALQQFDGGLELFFQLAGREGVVGLRRRLADEDVGELIGDEGEIAVAVGGGDRFQLLLRLVQIALAVIGHAQAITGQVGLSELGILFDDDLVALDRLVAPACRLAGPVGGIGHLLGGERLEIGVLGVAEQDGRQ